MSTAAASNLVSVPGWNTILMSTLDGLQACAEGCLGWQQEIARFTEHRWDENRRCWQALAGARDVADVAKIQHEWHLQMVNDYSDETARLGRLLTTLSLTGTTPDVQDTASLVA